MKIVIDENLKGKELYKFLVENKSQLIAQKKSMVKKTDAVESSAILYNVQGETITKAVSTQIPSDATSVRVKVVGNTAYYLDSQKDLLIPNCWNKTIKDRAGLIPHLHDHIHELDAEVGDVAKIYSQDVSLTDLGINRKGSTQSLMMESDVQKSYNPKVFQKYKSGRIKQHSIGLLYVSIDLAINDEESEKEFALWNKYIDLVINKDEAEADGFMWIVSEIKLLEISCVLFGSNKLTPTLEVKADTKEEPLQDTPIEPSEVPEQKGIDIEQLLKSFKSVQ
jgi:hypothetical protein